MWQFDVIDEPTLQEPKSGGRYAEIYQRLMSLPVGKTLVVKGFTGKKDMEMAQNAIHGGMPRKYIESRNGCKITTHRRHLGNDEWELLVTKLPV